MKISYALASGGGYTVLGDESARSALLESFAPSFAPQIQTEPLLGATNTFKAQRGNIAATVSLVVSVPYDTLANALAGMKSLKEALAAKCHLKVEQGATTHYYPNALLAGFTPTFTGLTVRYQVQFTTDDLTATSP